MRKKLGPREKSVMVVALAALCYGCQSNEASQRPESAWPAIVCFGDSLTAGYGLQPEDSYPAILQNELTGSGYRYRVVNLGESGNTTADGLRRLPEALAAKPAIVVLEFGANDALRGLPVPAMEANLERMVEAFQTAGARVLLGGMMWPAGVDMAAVPRFNAVYPQLARKYKAPLIPFFLAGVYGDPAFVQADGLHPNAPGAQQVATLVREYLQPMLQR